ncbi:hypothetical protein [Methylorubrum thiocyanatum]|uniref:hypothetical protein n=1 Tax=Methylorubrum thiocyanatum TaxID=47958 RepID=UPI00365FE0F2
MPISDPAAAREALAAASDGQHRMRSAITYGRAGPFLVVWGIVWLIGFTLQSALPERTAAIWLTVAVLGWVVTAGLTILQRQADRERGFSASLRYPLSAAVLSAYAALWQAVLLSQHPNAPAIYAGTVTGFAYLIGGLWRGPLLAGLGFCVTMLFLAGFLIAPPMFLLFAALVGGGGLIAAGLLLARRDPAP